MDWLPAHHNAIAVFAVANEQRSRTAAARDVGRARAALRTAGMPKHLRRALRLRIDHPTLSLAQIADVAGMTKDQLAGRIRRALAFARPAQLAPCPTCTCQHPCPRSSAE